MFMTTIATSLSFAAQPVTEADWTAAPGDCVMVHAPETAAELRATHTIHLRLTLKNLERVVGWAGRFRQAETLARCAAAYEAVVAELRRREVFASQQ